jgi:hypothetical protein
VNSIAATAVNDLYRPLMRDRGGKHYLASRACWPSAGIAQISVALMLISQKGSAVNGAGVVLDQRPDPSSCCRRWVRRLRAGLFQISRNRGGDFGLVMDADRVAVRGRGSLTSRGQIFLAHAGCAGITDAQSP